MSRYGWTGARRSPTASPYSTGSENLAITDDDFSYITSQDLENEEAARPEAARHGRTRSRGRSESPPEDDVLIVKSKGITYPLKFKAYSIYDGKVTVNDLQHRIGYELGLSERDTRDIRLLYKGRPLTNITYPVREYGVKNNSEILAVIRDIGRSNRGSMSGSEQEEVVVVTEGEHNTKRKKDKRGRRKGEKSEPTSPRSSGASLGVPSTSKARSPSPAVPRTAMEKLDAIAAQLDSELVPMCNNFMASPPGDVKNCEDAHRKLSETIFQKVLLKLDEVDTEGNEDNRARRKALVQHTQAVLKKLDEVKGQWVEELKGRR